MKVSEIILYTFRGLAVTLHCIGMYCLIKTKYSRVTFKVQRIYLINLSVSEIFLCSMSIVRRAFQDYLSNDIIYYIICFQYGGMVVVFYSAYILLTLDRFAIVFYNIKYNLKVTETRVRRVFYCVYAINVVLISMLVYVHPTDIKLLISNLTKYLWLPADLICIALVSVTYAYIFITRKKNIKKLFPTTRKQRQMKPKVTVIPTLLILTFISTFAIPDILYAVIEDIDINLSGFFSAVYGVGYILDAILYIFMLRSIRISLKK